MDEHRFCLFAHFFLWIVTSAEQRFNVTDHILIANVSQSITDNSTNIADQVVETRSLSNRWCDWSFSERDFVVSSPNYPQAYQPNLDCVIRVRRAPDTCGLLLVFESFDLEQSEGCQADFLQVDQERLCGTLPPHTTRTLTFTGSLIEMRFHSNAFAEERGFLLRASQTVCGHPPEVDSRAAGSVLLPTSMCDKSYSQPEFEITSPCYPQPYPNNVDCLYVIRKSSAEICALQITIAYLDVEVTQECFSSFIEWNQQRFCFPPEVNTQLFVFKETVFYIRFRSGVNPRRRLGFRLHVVQQKCPGPGPGPLPPYPPGPNPPGLCEWNLAQQNSKEPLGFELHSPGYPTSYPNNLDCVLRVRKATPTVCALEFTVQSFDVEDSVNCQYDFLSVENNRFCGRLPKGTTRYFNFFQPEMNIIFHSDERGAGCGFSLIFRQRDNCFVPPRPPLPPPLPPPGPSPAVHVCQVTFAEVGFVLVSPLVTVDTVCTYIVKKVGRKCALTLQFAEFDFGVDDLGCSRAYLEIRGERLCSHIIEGSTRSYIFEDDVFVMRFRSGISRPIFRINGLQRECPSPGPIPPRPVPPVPPVPPGPICENCVQQGPTVFISKDFRFSSPNFPQPYFPSLNCVYKVVKSSLSVCHLRIQVVEFDVESSFNCEKDALNIAGVKICGRREMGFTRSFDFFQRELVIRFESDAFGSGRGFLIDAFQEDCFYRANRTPPPYNPIVPRLFSPLCNRSYHMDELDVKYEDYPNYRGPFQCSYTINKMHKGICFLEIEYQRFELESSPSCSQHYLQVRGGERLCGLLAPSSTRRYDFPEDKIDINLSSEGGFNQAPGLHLHLRQLACDTATLSSNHISLGPYLPQPAKNNCDLETDKMQFFWNSPNYPNLYNNNQRCSLIIKKNHDSICAVDLIINYFLLEQSVGCSKDYFEILGRRFCGQISQQQRTIPFEVDELTLIFNSDGNIPSTGFHLLFQQRICDIRGPVFKRYSLGSRQINSSDYAFSNMSRSIPE